MISNLESKVEEVKRELPRDTFQLDSPLNNALLNTASLSVSSTGGGFALEPTNEETEAASPSSAAILAKLANSARKATLRFPSSARAHANLGAALLKAGDLVQAEQELQTALKLEADHYLAAMTLAKLFTQQKRLKEAEDLYRSLIANRTDDPLVPINLANIALERGDYSGAIEIISQAKHLHAVARLFILGLLRLRAGNTQEAIRQLRGAVRLDVRNPQLNNALGVAYAISKEYGKAERCFKAALSLAPQDGPTIRSLAKLYGDTKRAEEAVQLLHGYLEDHSEDLEARELLALAYIELGKPSGARAQLKNLLANEQGLTSVERSRHYCNIAVTYMREKDFVNAEKSLLISLESNSTASSIPHENYGRVLIFGLKDHVRAVRVLVGAKNIFPESISIPLLLSYAYAREYQYTAALEEVRPLRSRTDSSEVLGQIGSLYLELGELSNAAEVLREAFLKYPNDPVIINNLAYTLLAMDQVSEARMILQSYPRQGEPTSYFVATQGLLRLHEGDVEAARWLYKRAENIAKRTGDKELVRRVRQKMHLELAKHFLKVDNLQDAKKEITASKAEKVRFYSYESEIDLIEKQVNSRLGE